MSTNSKFKPGQSSNPKRSSKRETCTGGNRASLEIPPVLVSDAGNSRSASTRRSGSRGVPKRWHVWEATRDREPWAVRAPLRGVAPEAKQINLTQEWDNNPGRSNLPSSCPYPTSISVQPEASKSEGEFQGTCGSAPSLSIAVRSRLARSTSSATHGLRSSHGVSAALLLQRIRVKTRWETR